MENVLFEDAVVAVVSMEAGLDASSLSAGERGLIDAAHGPHRALELLAGRLAAKRAFEAAGLARPPAVLRAFDGRPRLEPPSEGWFVSIAHEATLAAAAVSRAPVGVDLLTVTRFDSAAKVVTQRQASGRARPLEPHAPAPWPDAALCWTAWEAMGKLDGRGVLPAMSRAIAVLPQPDGLSGRSGPLRLRWWEKADALFCLATAGG